MAGVLKVNPVAVATNWEQVGKDITFFTVDYIDDISTQTGPLDLIQAAYTSIQLGATIIAAGPLFDAGSQQTFGVEGVLAPADLTAIATAIQEAGHNAGTTVTATNLGIATTAAI